MELHSVKSFLSFSKDFNNVIGKEVYFYDYDIEQLAYSAIKTKGVFLGLEDSSVEGVLNVMFKVLMPDGTKENILLYSTFEKNDWIRTSTKVCIEV